MWSDIWSICCSTYYSSKVEPRSVFIETLDTNKFNRLNFLSYEVHDFIYFVNHKWKLKAEQNNKRWLLLTNSGWNLFSCGPHTILDFIIDSFPLSIPMSIVTFFLPSFFLSFSYQLPLLIVKENCSWSSTSKNSFLTRELIQINA